MVSAFNKVISVLNRLRNGVTWLADKLGGVDKMFRLIAMTAGIAFTVLNFSKITAGLSSISKLLTSINVKTLAIIAVALLLALVVRTSSTSCRATTRFSGPCWKRPALTWRP